MKIVRTLRKIGKLHLVAILLLGGCAFCPVYGATGAFGPSLEPRAFGENQYLDTIGVRLASYFSLLSKVF